MAKQKKKIFLVLWLLLIIIIGALTTHIIGTYEKQQEEKRKAVFTYFPSYGINIPAAYLLHGIDVSTHQEDINWQLVKQGNDSLIKINFAFIKATEGLISVDKQFAQNWQNAKLSGIARGAYHFFIATKDGTLQAQNFINAVKLEPGDLPPVVDIEELYGASPDSMRIQLKAFVNTIQNAYHIQPIIYSYADFYEEYLKKYFDDYPLWVAHYNVENAKDEQGKKVSLRNWIFWQHSQEAHVNGIKPKVDFDVFSGDSTAFQQLLIK